MIIYMIRDKKTNNLSNGGTSPKFTRNGKIWTGMGALKNHLNLGIHTYYPRHQSTEIQCIYLSESFIPYLDTTVIRFDTETLTCENFKDNFLLDYYREKFQTKSYDGNTPIHEETRNLLCL